MTLKKPSVVLVGRRLEHNENLGLAYLRAALDRGGVSVTTHYVNDAGGLAKAAMAILATTPDVVGLSLTDGGSAVLPLTLGEALSRGGYSGHIAVGGPFATLARTFLLDRYRFIDSVVRLAGEVPFPALVHRVARGESVFGIPSVTTREGDGPPAPVLDPSPMVLSPDHDELPDILGHRAAHILATRGCAGRCHYCGPMALQSLERREGLRAGISGRTLSEQGIGGVRRRSVGDVCDEMAELWHQRDVRYFYFVDEHLLPYDEPSALTFLSALRDGLARRHVGALGIGTMLRADRLTPALIRAFAEVGLVRAFVGLELASDEEARRFGRPAPTACDLELLKTFAAASVTTVSNLMLLHPYATPATVRRGIDLLASISHGVFQVSQMMAYHGTRLANRLASEQRLTGNPLRYGYTFDDPVMTRFAEVFARLRGEAFWEYTVAFRTHDAYLSLGLNRRLNPERAQPALELEVDSVRRSVNSLFVDAYTRALDLAVSGGGYEAAAPLIADARAAARVLDRQLDSIESRMFRPASRSLFSPMRAAATCAFSFAVAGASACGARTELNASPLPDGGVTAPVDSGVVLGDSGVDSGCPANQPAATADQIAAVVTAADACFSGDVSVGQPGTAPSLYSQLPDTVLPLPELMSGVLGICSNPIPPGSQAIAAAVKAACLSSGPVVAGRITFSVASTVKGGSSTDAQRMVDAITATCAAVDAGVVYSLRIALDATGKVTDVTTSPVESTLSGCMKSALAGLEFPCLANMTVCTEDVIVE